MELRVAVNVEVGVADHVGQQECLDVLERAVLLPFVGEVADAVEAVGGGPILDCFFAVGPQEPDAVAFALFAAQLVGQFEQDGSGRAAVVGADVAGVAQRIVGVVVAGDDDDAFARAGKFGDYISYGKLAFGSVGGEGVVFDLVVLEVGQDVIFQLLVIRAADRAGAEGYDLAGVLHGASGVEGLGVGLDAENQCQ